MKDWENSSVHFNFRVAGVAISRGRLLVHRNEKEANWSLPGGRIQPLEFSSDALVREMSEELGAVVTVERTLWVMENLFGYEEGKQVHEICFYYLMKLADDDPLHANDGHFDGDEAGERLIFFWLPLSELATAPFNPDMLKQRLLNIPDGVEVIVANDLG
ncbi:NUDIX hydrolase [bacterium]|nr:NUDIX hydrolase [bacterium]